MKCRNVIGDFRTCLVAILVLWQLLPGLAQNGTAVTTVGQASQALTQAQEAGLDISWTGLGQVAGEMVDATFTNNSSQPMEIKLIPGIVLTDSQEESQPIMLEDHVVFTLQPGESTPIRNIRAYCLDHSKEPPALGKGVDYKVATDLTQYESAIQHLWAGLRLDSTGKFQPVLKPLQHRTVVIQRAIWASLGSPNPESMDKLQSDLEADVKAGNHPFSGDKVKWLAEQLWRDVKQTQDAAPQE